MIEIDWSKAPEGATHYLPAKIGFTGRFYNLGKTPILVDFCKGAGWEVSGNSPGGAWLEDLVARPTAPQWNGEGLPPPGTECEYFAKTEQRWIPVVMIGVFRNSPVLGCVETGVVGQLDLECYKLRPRRTPEQIAAEERDSAINQMIRCIKDNPRCLHGVAHLAHLRIQEDACRDLYEAGYRKIPDEVPSHD